jgi:hypothetical protein
MKQIIDPVYKEIIKKEINQDRLLRITLKWGNEIYVVNQKNSPHVLQEIGRLREITFRESGGGTGESIDLDEHDVNDYCYEQLIVWSPEDQEIIGGYRFIRCEKAIDDSGKIHLSTSHYFEFSSHFVFDYLPYTIELGRSWIQPNFQATTNPKKGLFALDNIWDGLGALVIQNPTMKYFFGKVTMYPTFNQEARDFLLHFMHHYFSDNEKLMHPFHKMSELFEMSEVLAESLCSECSNLRPLPFPSRDGISEVNATI